MTVFITRPAKESLRAIFDYYKSKGYETYASRLRASVITKAKTLSKQHQRGQQEEFLKPLGQGHRYLIVEKHYKIIYLVEEKRVLVTDVFDTRQKPQKLLRRHM